MPIEDNQNSETARVKIADFARKYAACYAADDIDPELLVQLIEASPTARQAVTQLDFNPNAVRRSGGIVFDDGSGTTLRDHFALSNKNKVLIDFNYQAADSGSVPAEQLECCKYVRNQTFEVLSKLQVDDELWSEIQDNLGSSWGLIDLIEEWSEDSETGGSTFLEWLNDSMSLGLEEYFNLKVV